jgi:hypothetical protein
MNKLDKFLFVEGSVKFEEIEEGKIQCGGCKEKFSRIVGHLTQSIACTQNIDLEEFKSKWTKFSEKREMPNVTQLGGRGDQQKYFNVYKN